MSLHENFSFEVKVRDCPTARGKHKSACDAIYLPAGGEVA